jgi:hypothetical protein
MQDLSITSICQNTVELKPTFFNSDTNLINFDLPIIVLLFHGSVLPKVLELKHVTN